MKKKTIIIAVSAAVSACAVAAFILFICLKTPENKTESDGFQETVQLSPKGRELLKYVPTDAIGVLSCCNTESALETLFDSDSRFRSLDFESFKSSRIAISYHYLGALHSMMLLELGRKDVDSKFAPMKDELEKQGLYYRLFQDPVTRETVLAASECQTVLETAALQSSQNTSILDMEGLADIIEDVDSQTSIIVFSNKDLSRLAGAEFLSKYYYGKFRKSLFDFIGDCASWTVLKYHDTEPSGDGEYIHYNVSTVSDNGNMSYLKVLDAQKGAESHVSEILPHRTDFLLDIPIENLSAFISDREEYLDAKGLLVENNKSRTRFQNYTGKSPQALLESIEAREVAVIRWRNCKVLAIRSGKTVPAAKPRESGRFQDLLGIVFGEAFTIPDTMDGKKRIKNESYYVVNNNWYIIGSKYSVDHFFDYERRHTGKFWPAKDVKLIVLAGDIQLNWTQKAGKTLGVYRPF